MECRLCGSDASFLGHTLGGRSRPLWLCPCCDSISVPPDYLPPFEEERARYLEHENLPSPGYRDFLHRLAIPAARSVRPSATGLDYGCGPVPYLSTLLGELGISMKNYDPCFANDRSCLSETFDLITVSEVAEHFHAPEKEFNQLKRLLRPRGVLAIMTQQKPSWDGVLGWPYARDPTHVILYSPRTMRWIADRWSWDLEEFPKSVTLFRQRAGLQAEPQAPEASL